MESEIPEMKALMQIPLIAAHMTSRKKQDNYLDKTGPFSHRNLKREGRFLPTPVTMH